MLRRLEIFLLLVEFYRYLGNFLMLILLDEEMDGIMTASRVVAAEMEATLSDRGGDPPTRILNYVERTIPGLTSKQFQEHFSMTPDIFNIIMREFAPLITTTNKYCSSSRKMDPQKQLLAVLWLLATPDSYRSVAERFDMGKSSLHISFVIIVKVLCNKSRYLIKWPLGREVLVANKFEKCAGIPGIIGAIDGTYIQIKAPINYPERYINRKCQHAITLQAVCDADLYFTDIFVGYPSSVNDCRIFTNSDLYKNVISKSITIPRDFFIIGDKAYPVLYWCIPPYIERQPLTHDEKKFNTAMAKSRQCIERSFALLKGRFRRLKYLDMCMTSFIPNVILACCVLHNICLLNGSDHYTIENFIKEGLPDVIGEDSIDESIEDLQRDGRALRTRLMLNLRE